MSENLTKTSNGIEFTLSPSTSGPVILFFTSKGDFDRSESLSEELKNTIQHGFSFASIKVSDWNSDYSPWRYEMSEDEIFKGNGKQTLKVITEDFLPLIKEKCGECTPIYAIGYSLAGLFSLWALFESDFFAGVASVSGSLWFEGFEDYIKAHVPKKEATVYLSLGGKEANTSHSVMSQIMTKTKQIHKLLKNKNNISGTTFELNRGGHFANPTPRLAKSVLWLTTN